MMNDELCVVHPRAAGLDVHKGHITATVRLADPTADEPRFETRMFNALASGLAALVAWSTGHRVAAAAMEATGVYWYTPWQGPHRRRNRGATAPRSARQATPRPKDRRRGQPLARTRVPVRVGAAQFRPVTTIRLDVTDRSAIAATGAGDSTSGKATPGVGRRATGVDHVDVTRSILRSAARRQDDRRVPGRGTAPVS